MLALALSMAAPAPVLVVPPLPGPSAPAPRATGCAVTAPAAPLELPPAPSSPLLPGLPALGCRGSTGLSLPSPASGQAALRELVLALPCRLGEARGMAIMWRAEAEEEEKEGGMDEGMVGGSACSLRWSGGGAL